MDKDPIRPIPFLEETPLQTETHDRVTIVSAVESPSDILPGKTRTHKIAARTRQVIPIDVTNFDIDEGYLPLIDSPEGVFVGHAAVTASNGSCYALAINSTEGDIELQIPPQELTPYDVFDEESDCFDDVFLSEPKPSLSVEERLVQIQEKIRFDQLGPHRQQRVKSYIEAFPYLFLLEGDRLPGTSLTQHEIPTVDNVPVFHKQYRYPEVHKAEVRKQISKLLENGVITPSSSPYNSPLWIVPKKADENGNRRWRLVIDFRALNEKTIGDAYPLPNINEILDHLGGAKYFSVFDLASGFHQIPMNPEDKYKTAFSTDNGHFEFNRMPFGLKGAPASFQRLMDRVLIGLQGVELFVYIDDIVVYASTLDEHDEKIFRLFKRLKDAGLRLQPEKCSFLSTEVTYLGHVISEEGVRPNPKKNRGRKKFSGTEESEEYKGILGTRRLLSEIYSERRGQI